MSLPVRVGTLLVAFLAVVGGAIFASSIFCSPGPPVIDSASRGTRQPGQPRHAGDAADHGHQQARLGQSTSSRTRRARSGCTPRCSRFRPASTVNVTVLGYDGCTPPRNLFFGQVTGTIGNYRDHRRQDGQSVDGLADLLDRAHVLDPRHRAQRADGNAHHGGGEQRPVRHGAVPARGRRQAGSARDDEVQLQGAHHGGQLHVAVPDPLRRRLSSTGSAARCRPSAT